MPDHGFTHESTHNESIEWYTPPGIFKALRLEFDLDPASPGAARVPWLPAKKHLTAAEDGLKTPWEGRVWLNPPYGSETTVWMEKFVAHHNGVMLVFSRTDTWWFHNLAVKADALCFVKGRIKFVASNGEVGKSGSGAGSLLLACGSECVEALRNSGLGFFVEI